MSSFTVSKIGHLFGQDHLVPVLDTWMKNPERIPHSLLISGPYGMGKSSIARLLSRVLATNDSDIEEINAAAFRGIDDVRSLIEAARFSPLGSARVVILDELHALTNAAQSALLKVIETPPSSLYYFLCTTEPQKLLPTIRSRCIPLEVKLLKEPQAFELIDFLSKGSFPPEVKSAIFRRSQGHARDIVNLTGIAQTSGTVQIEELEKQFGPSVFDVQVILQGLLSKGEITEQGWQKVTSFPEHDALGRMVDEMVDKFLFHNQKVKEHYSKLLDIRLHRKNYNLNAVEQFNHLVAICKN
jgi:DNA polymerase-3 subunit gamma/tau